MDLPEMKRKVEYFKVRRGEIMLVDKKIKDLSSQYKKEFHDFFGITLDAPVEIHDLIEILHDKLSE